MEVELVPVDAFDALLVDVKRPGDADDDDDDDALRRASNITKYPAKQHARRVVRELDVADGLVYLPGQIERAFEDSDQDRAFRQRRYFYYLSGANFEDCAVTFDIGRDRLTLWIPYVEPRDVLWFGSKPGAAECLRRFDVDEVRYTTDLSKFLRRYAAAPSPPTIYVLHPDQTPPLPLPSTSSQQQQQQIRFDFEVLQAAMDRARLVKTDYEVAMMRRANDISSKAHRKVAERILSLTSERQVEAIFQGVSVASGAPSQAYPIIAASGTNASTLHYSANSASLRNKQCLVLDAGCEWDCYASDITRTLPLSGRFSPRAAAVHRIVQRMQDECISLVRPGKLWREIYLHAVSVAAEGLLELGILKGGEDPERAIRAGTVAAFFPHGLGHHVGLEVHDLQGSMPLAAAAAAAPTAMLRGKRSMMTPEMLVACLEDPTANAVAGPQSERKQQRLAKNMVVTVEPGIYFCREYLEGFFRNDPTHGPLIDWDLLEEYYDVGGVRIEDCILVTADGYDNLTTAPKGDELLDIINRGPSSQVLDETEIYTLASLDVQKDPSTLV